MIILPTIATENIKKKNQYSHGFSIIKKSNYYDKMSFVVENFKNYIPRHIKKK